MASSYAAYVSKHTSSAKQGFIKFLRPYPSLSHTPKSFFHEKAFSFSK